MKKWLPSLPMPRISPYQFSFFRIAFGLYLLWHFAALLPYGKEIFSREGMLPDPALNPTYSIFPNLLAAVDTPAGVAGFLWALIALSSLFTAGVLRRTAAVALWYGWACLYNRNVLIANPSIPFVGWILLASAVIPLGEPLALRRKHADEAPWSFPRSLFIAAWAIMALSYTVSGLHKMGSQSWMDGSALTHLLNNPLARDTWFRTLQLGLPTWMLQTLSWGVLALEVSFAPLSLFRQGRFAAWTLMLGAHVGILACVAFADLTAAMLLVHAFTFDPSWIPARKARGSADPVVFFDGVCGLCNSFVDFLLAEDAAALFKLAPLQGETASRVLPQGLATRLDTIALVDEAGRVHTKSDAVLAIFGRLGGFWRLLSFARFLPRALRDTVYDFVARNRYAWFGKLDACRMPTSAERARLLG